MISNNEGMVMPVAPMYGNGGSGLGGDWGSWIILFLIFGMFGGNGWGNNGNQGANPWLLAASQRTDESVQSGFNQAALTGQLSGIQGDIASGFGNVQTALCGGFAGVNASINGAQNAIAQQMYGNQIADLERSFAAQTANTQAISGISSQLADCCCANRLATVQTQNIVQSEGNATRVAEANNTRDIIASQTASTQAILDKLCALELDGYKRENDNLRSQLNMATLRESQTAQNAFIQAGFSNEVDQLYNRLNTCPVPTTPVFGRTPIFTCGNNGYAGCGCGA